RKKQRALVPRCSKKLSLASKRSVPAKLRHAAAVQIWSAATGRRFAGPKCADIRASRIKQRARVLVFEKALFWPQSTPFRQSCVVPQQSKALQIRIVLNHARHFERYSQLRFITHYFQIFCNIHGPKPCNHWIEYL